MYMHYDQGTYMYMHRADMHHVYMHQGQGFSMHEKFASSYMHPIRLLESPCPSVRPSVTEKYRIVHSQCVYDMYDAIVMMMKIIIICVRCDHHHDDNHHPPCIMQ